MREPHKKEQQVYDDGTNTFFWYDCAWDCPTIPMLFHHRQAHTISAGALICLGLIYVALFEQPHNDTMFNIQRGVVAVVVVFILIGMIHMPNGPFVRPHPALWRLVLCVLILYVLLLIFMLFQVCGCVFMALYLLASYLAVTIRSSNSIPDVVFGMLPRALST